jgi:hypothetical protein
MNSVLYLPVYPGMSDDDLKRLTGVVRSFESARANALAGTPVGPGVIEPPSV